MARLVALGDSHLGRSHLAHLRDEQGRNVREEDFLRSFTWAVDETIRQEPDGFLWLGDIFDHARPTYRTFAHVLAGLQQLADAGLRVEVDARQEKVNFKIREAQLQKVPYMLVVGDREAAEDAVSVRSRAKGDLGARPLDQFTADALAEVAAKTLS